MSTSKYIFPAKVVNVVDGDTFDLNLDLGFGIQYENQRFRLHGVDAYEVRLYEGVTEEQKKLGLEVKQRLKDFFALEPFVMVETDKSSDPDKYGRYLATIWAKGVACSDALPIDIIREQGGVVIPDSFEPKLTLVDSQVGKTFERQDFFNLNYWLVANGYAIEKEY